MPVGMLKRQGLVLVWRRILTRWFHDDDPGLAPTMAALDRELTRGGRIIDGNVIDVLELEDDETGQLMILLVYNYDVAGVTYEASQDVTHLRQFIDLYSCRLGLPASVKYDPHNPGDSIVISETWSGLRKPTIVMPQKPVLADTRTSA